MSAYGVHSGREGKRRGMRTAMGSFGRPEDGRLARLPHVRSLRLSRQKQRVRVCVGRVVEDPAHEAQDGDGEERRVQVPAGEEVGNGAIQLLE